MLYLIDPANVAYYVCPDEWGGFALLIPRVLDKPWEIGYKPIPSSEDELGNTCVDHCNIHGVAWKANSFATPTRFSASIFLNGAEVTRAWSVGYYYRNNHYGSSATRFIPWLSGLTHDIIVWNPGKSGYHLMAHLTKSTRDEIYSVMTRLRFISSGSGWGTMDGFTCEVTVFYASLPYNRLYEWNKSMRSPASMTLTFANRNWAVKVYSSGERSRCRTFRFETSRIYGVEHMRSQDEALIKELTRICFDACYPVLPPTEVAQSYRLTDYEIYSRHLSAPWQFRDVCRYKRLLKPLIETVIPFETEEEDFGEATRDAVEQARSFAGNGIAYVSEVAEMRQTVKSLSALLRRDVSPQALSNLWLAWRYGLRLTAADTAEICEGFVNSLSRQKLRKGCAWVRGKAAGKDARVKIYYAPSQENLYLSMVQTLMNWDILPDFTNVWDLIPFSFVVDWFVDFESFFDSVDVRTYLGTYDVKSCLYTIKGAYVPASLSFGGMHGQLELTRFKRVITQTPVMPSLTLRGSLPSFNNILDGISLIVGRK